MLTGHSIDSSGNNSHVSVSPMILPVSFGSRAAGSSVVSKRAKQHGSLVVLRLTADCTVPYQLAPLLSSRPFSDCGEATNRPPRMRCQTQQVLSSDADIAKWLQYVTVKSPHRVCWSGIVTDGPLCDLSSLPSYSFGPQIEQWADCGIAHLRKARAVTTNTNGEDLNGDFALAN